MRSLDSDFPVSWNKMSLFGLVLNYTDATIIINNEVQWFLNYCRQDH